VTPSTGLCRINGVSAGEISINLLTPAPSLHITYALADTKNVTFFGSGKRNVGWSEETMKKLADFVASAEADICADLFEGGATTGGGAVQESPTTDGVPSL
jgi:hypothetical protein